jgi:hypothetical protein
LQSGGGAGLTALDVVEILSDFVLHAFGPAPQGGCGSRGGQAKKAFSGNKSRKSCKVYQEDQVEIRYNCRRMHQVFP